MDHQPNEVLQKIYRDFTKDEALAVLISELKAMKFEFGIIKSERDEYKALLAEKTGNKDWEKEKDYQDLKKKLKEAKEKNVSLRKDAKYWESKYFYEISKSYIPSIDQKTTPNETHISN
jgi:uncharacterized protein YhaN